MKKQYIFFFLSDRSGFTLGKIQTFLEVIVIPVLQFFSEQKDKLCNIVNSSFIFVYVHGNSTIIATLIYTKNIFWTFTSRTIQELYRITSTISWELEQKYEMKGFSPSAVTGHVTDLCHRSWIIATDAYILYFIWGIKGSHHLLRSYQW